MWLICGCHVLDIFFLLLWLVYNLYVICLWLLFSCYVVDMWLLYGMVYGFYMVSMWLLCGGYVACIYPWGMSGPLSVTHVGTWNDEECGDWECDTASDGIGPDGATSQDRASSVPVSTFSPLCFK